MRIVKCEEGHYSILEDNGAELKCPMCGKEMHDFAEYMEGDCVACGQLCPSYAYCCTNPKPYKHIESENK